MYHRGTENTQIKRHDFFPQRSQSLNRVEREWTDHITDYIMEVLTMHSSSIQEGYLPRKTRKDFTEKVNLTYVLIRYVKFYQKCKGNDNSKQNKMFSD